MMKSRGAAVIGAFALIALAIIVRGLLDDGGSGKSSNGPKKGRDDGAPVVACTPELMAVCDALAADGDIAANPPELDLPDAADPSDKIDGWITWSPAPQIANYLGSSKLTTLVWGTPEALGSAPEAILIDTATDAGLPAGCRVRPTWGCLGTQAPDLSIGVGDPATAEGIARLTPFARTFAVDDDHTTLDSQGLAALVRSPAEGQTDAAAMAERLTTRLGSLSMVAGPEALLKRQTATPAGRARGLRVIAPGARAKLTAVLAPRAGREGEVDHLACQDLSDDTTDAIAKAGLASCSGSVDDALAGFLFQVQKKVG